MKTNLYHKQRGQALISILIITFVILSWAVQIAVTNLSSVSTSNEFSTGEILLEKAEGYLENGAISYLRNSAYNGESLQEDNISCTIMLSDITGGKHITSSCSKNNRSRKVGLSVTYANGIFSFTKIAEEE